MLFNFIKKSNAEITIVKEIDRHNSDWGGKGIIFYVKNGKGLLSMKYGYLDNDALAALIFGDIPLRNFMKKVHISAQLAKSCCSRLWTEYERSASYIRIT